MVLLSLAKTCLELHHRLNFVTFHTNLLSLPDYRLIYAVGCFFLAGPPGTNNGEVGLARDENKSTYMNSVKKNCFHTRFYPRALGLTSSPMTGQASS